MSQKNLSIGLVCLSLNVLIAIHLKAAETSSSGRTFESKGVIIKLPADHQTIVIRHEAISNYMSAMTMPFPVRQPSVLRGLHVGDEVTFQLHVTDDDSWVDTFTRIGTTNISTQADNSATPAPHIHSQNPLLHFQFTNELGQPVSLSDFPGQALAITFFYTRCPLPNYCPRLSRNFEEASEKLESMTNAPANWHFLSISFDPQFDTPPMLKAYGQSYNYDPAHWSFLTGPVDKINELAQACGVTTTADGSTINHNFRTLIINASGHLQMVFPTTGDLSGQIVDQIIQAASVTNSVQSSPKKT